MPDRVLPISFSTPQTKSCYRGAKKTPMNQPKLKQFHPHFAGAFAARLACAILVSACALHSQQTQNPAPVASEQPTGTSLSPQAEVSGHPTDTNSLTPQASTPPAPATAAPARTDSQAGAITEEQLRQALLGKPFYLRNCYLDAELRFNEHGSITGHPSAGSYTLCGVEIGKVKLSKHKVELLGARYALHFLGAMPYEDPTKAVDRVRITPNKKFLRITIDRELVVKPKKIKNKSKGKEAAAQVAPALPSSTSLPRPASIQSGQEQATTTPASSPNNQSGSAANALADEAAENEPSAAEQLQMALKAAPEQEKPADPNSITTTTSPAHAQMVLRDALDKIFAPGLDERMMASMPDFWKLYYQAAAAKSDYRPRDPNVLRQNSVDRKARLISNFEPPSNEFAQAAGVAGMALYHVVIGPDGKPGEIAVARPIGFGLDENAASAIRDARFEPALKDGKPVPVLVDLVVQFRIFSNRTALMPSPPAADKNNKVDPSVQQAPILPGPYSRQQ